MPRITFPKRFAIKLDHKLIMTRTHRHNALSNALPIARLSCATLLAAATLMLAPLSRPAMAGEFDLPNGPGQALIYAKCRTCHDLQYVIESKGLTADAWDGLLYDMEGFGVQLTDDEYTRVLTYLSTYMSDQPAPAPSDDESAPEQADGAMVFADNCTSCHQEDATGIEETFPPLAKNNDLFLATDFPVKVLLNGMSGSISVNDMPFEGEMPSFGHLPDIEIAAVINYLRSNFGNDAKAHPDISEVTANSVATLREKAMDPEQVLALRASLK